MNSTVCLGVVFSGLTAFLCIVCGAFVPHTMWILAAHSILIWVSWGFHARACYFTDQAEMWRGLGDAAHREYERARRATVQLLGRQPW